MKYSIAVSVLILAVASMIGWANHRWHTVVTENHRSLAEEAAALGLSTDLESAKGAALARKRPREDKDAQARLAAKEFIASMLKLQVHESGDELDRAMQDRYNEFNGLLLSLDAGQLKIVIAELLASKEMEDEIRTRTIRSAMSILATVHPESALTLFAESGFDNKMMGKQVLFSSVESWASTEPDRALAWYRENKEKHPGMIPFHVKSCLVTGAGSKSLALGFKVLGEVDMGWASSESALSNLVGTIDSSEERTEYLTLIREYKKAYMKANPNAIDMMQQLSSLGKEIAKDGFKEGSRWLAENELSEKEISTMVTQIGYHANGVEKGQWIEWMGANLSEKGRDDMIKSTMRQWTERDSLAAGTWLAATPDGPAKGTAVSAYAATVASQDPQIAAQWALTLPAGQRRNETLKAIYKSWPQDTPESKAQRADFAEKYGIK